jgi:murein DD-endopeptidase MepM/ murein hydrolase activator NlpD
MGPSRGALLLAVLATAGGLFLAFVLVLGSMMGSTPDGTAPCGTGPAGATGSVLPAGAAAVGGLSTAQLANAGAVIAEGRRRQVPPQAVVIALAVASQESHFTIYANDGRGGDLAYFQLGVDASLSLPHEAVGTDHGSLGVFQQQWPWWGTMPDLMDPARSAGKFYDALLQVPGWQRMPVTVAAQTVQRSAYPDAYADDEGLARRLLGTAGTATTADVVPASAASGSCAVPGDPGRVAFPLPRDTEHLDNRNWGDSGSHWARMHTGTDFSAACGTPVLAATAGRVVVRTDQPWSGRWLVQVSTGIGRLTTWYAHLQSLSVAPGATVTAGQQIGEVGALGNATGCHLHFEVHPRGGSIYQDSVDPSVWLSENVGRDTGEAVPASWSSGSEAFTVATFNVLGDSHTRASGDRPAMASGAARMPGVVRLLEKYGVDVVGLQELQRPQHRALLNRTGSTFAAWSAPDDTENAIAWRRERWDLVSARTLAVPYFDGHRRRMPVVRLRDRVTGRESFFVNVHNPADTRRYPRQARWRDAAVAREVALVRRLRASTGLPVFLTGDLNDRRSVYCRLTGAGMRASNDGGTAVTGGACSPPRRAGIDWVFGAGAQFSDHTVDRSPAVRATSDHPFVVTRARVG